MKDMTACINDNNHPVLAWGEESVCCLHGAASCHAPSTGKSYLCMHVEIYIINQKYNTTETGFLLIAGVLQILARRSLHG